MMYNLVGFFGISFSVSQALRTLMGEIIALIFSLIEYLYSTFIYLSKAQILDNDFIQSIYFKVGMILGIFMVFKLTFSLIQSLIDPNKFTDKKNGFAAIIGRCVLSIVLLGITPAIFREAFKLQNLLVGGGASDNVIYKLVSGHSAVGNLDNMGRVLASDLYFSFFTDNEDPRLKMGIKDEIPSDIDEREYYDRFITDDYGNLVNSVKDPNSGKTFHDTVTYLSVKNATTGQYVIEFNWLLLLITGLLVVWILVMYCVQVAIRVVQLAYLQLIAPVPILSYISDPDGAFKKWIQQCLTTFLDLFIRLAIIYFVMTMIGDVLNQFAKAGGIIFESTGIPREQWFTLSLVKILIIIGLLLFAKKVPELLKDLFPNLGGGAGKFSFGLNPRKEVFEPLKQMYNSTPLGWAPKALGLAGKKAVAPITRNYQNWKSDRENFKKIREKEKPGERLFNRYYNPTEQYDGILDAFSSDDFKKSYAALEDAKKEKNDADREYKLAKDSGDVIRLEAAVNRQAEAEKQFKKAEKWHNNNREKFGADARRQDNFDTYKSMHPDKVQRPAQQQPVRQQPAQQQPVRQQSVQQQPAQQPSPEIEVVNEIRNNSRYKEQEQAKVDAQVKAEVDEANRQNSSNISSASGLSQEQLAAAESYRQEIEKLINYKKNARDPKDIQEIDMEIEAKTKELNKLIGKE